jgi:uncharacterized protein
MKTTGNPTHEMPDVELEFIELDSAQSLRLLRSHHLGRVAFAHESWPVILPVNYAFDEPTIVIRTSPGAKVTSAPFHMAAFEVDDSDPAGRWGWSVLAQGPVFEITDSLDDRSVFLRSLLVTPAAPGRRDRWLAISALHLSGRAFGEIPNLGADETGDGGGSGELAGRQTNALWPHEH